MMSANLSIRSMSHSDLPGVLATMNRSFGSSSWGEAEFAATLQSPDWNIAVAELSGSIVGYTITNKGHDRQLILWGMAVDPLLLRQRIGTAMVNNIKSREPDRYKKIACPVEETDVIVQVFFRACGFRATCIKRDFWADGTDEDAYWFEYQLPQVPPSVPKSKPARRLRR